eukprot:TRINITY_DN54362_c0_g1_i1.p2 TRINITY_DN54362_c0_g1~~TRINITY_DN54362_c0_g1_i1.p2  ORF type:complete len:253 (-),score=84.17 TRINITY_DN54362_c0_g1_i1:115-873(-)
MAASCVAPAFVALLPLLLQSAFAVKTDIDNGVLVLTEESFDPVVSKFPAVVVEFYAPWCGHCKQLQPSYDKAAKKLRKLNSTSRMAKVDATTDFGQKAAKKYGATGFPTLIGFRNGEVATVYDGPREKDELVDFVQALEGNPSLMQPLLMYSQVRYNFKMLLRLTPVPGGLRKVLSKYFVLVILAVTFLPCFLCLKCCCGDGGKAKAKAAAAQAKAKGKAKAKATADQGAKKEGKENEEKDEAKDADAKKEE